MADVIEFDQVFECSLYEFIADNHGYIGTINGYVASNGGEELLVVLMQLNFDADGFSGDGKFVMIVDGMQKKYGRTLIYDGMYWGFSRVKNDDTDYVGYNEYNSSEDVMLDTVKAKSTHVSSIQKKAGLYHKIWNTEFSDIFPTKNMD